MGRESPPYTVKEYRLSLDVDYETLEFRGQVAIDLDEVHGPVALDSVELAIDTVTAGGHPLKFEVDAVEGELRVQNPPQGSPTIEVGFSGHARERGLMGLYKTRLGAYYALVTDLEPIAARRVFPCVDRPDRKAPIAFDLTVGLDDDVVANTPIVEQRTRGSRKRLTFLPTPPMATYLFFFAVGPFEVLKGRASHVRMGVLAPVERSAAGAFALERASAILPAFEEYFGVAYPLSKLDLIAIPEMAQGAMENWGAITFSERVLLVDPATATRAKRTVVSTIAHEIAHQWFGNLVTMSWWSDIWLNESFATFLEAKILDQLYPELQSIPTFLINWTSSALDGDSSAATHPVQLDVERPEEIAEIFDMISYGKGASVLRMIESYISPDSFRAGTKAYLEKFRFGNASSVDLWTSLEGVAGQPLVPLLSEWIGRPGHPVVVAHQEGENLVLEQRRHRLEAERPTEPPWPIPLSYRVNGVSKRMLFSTERESLPVGPVHSLHLNERATGFYRVRYSDSLYDRLLVDWDALSSEEQWSILHDLYSFLLSGDADLDLYLRFVARAAAGPGSPAVLELAREYSGLDVFQEPPPLTFVLPDHPLYQASFASLIDGQLGRVGLEPRETESDSDRILRSALTRCLLWNRPEGAAVLAGRFESFDTLDADLRLPVACAFARGGGEREHAELMQRLEAAETDTAALQMSLALACVRDPELVRRTLELLSNGTIWRSHIPRTVITLARNPEARGLTWEWMAQAASPVMADLSGTGYASWTLSESLPVIGLGREAEVETELTAHPWPETTMGLKRGLEGLRATSALRRRLA